ncbi:RagB/SusD family nutrient uptake outer membrane protein [Dysgonomonas reticulitermitis]
MKKYLFILTMVMLGITSCNDFLDRNPISDMSPTTFFTTKGDMRSWNAGIYNAMQLTLNVAHLSWGDLRSDSYESTGYADSNDLYINGLKASNSGYASWNNLYSCIARCNIAIENYPEIPQILESEYSNYIGQAYGMRALMYFYALRVWGGVPIVTKSWDGDVSSTQIGRATIEEVKAQIMSDLTEAKRYLNNPTDKFYFSTAAYYALKTDVHMWFKEYDEALSTSDYFINNSNFTLVNSEIEWKQMFLTPGASKEIILAVAWDYATNGASGWPSQLGASNTNNGFMMSKAIFETFIDRLRSGKGTDSRFWNTLDTVKIFYNTNRIPLTYASYKGTSGIEKNTKYCDVDPNRVFNASYGVYQSHWLVLSTSNAAVQFPVYRLADVLLLRAEALNKLSRGAEALNVVNNIRKRVGYKADAAQEAESTDKAKIENIILQERQLEFLGEGKRWFDLVRTDKVIDIMDPIYKLRQSTPVGFGDPGRILFPIYTREFEANSALEQNYPYTKGN